MAFGDWAVIVGAVPVFAHLSTAVRGARQDLRSIYDRIDEDLADRL